jgi:hypothetical protein
LPCSIRVNNTTCLPCRRVGTTRLNEVRAVFGPRNRHGVLARHDTANLSCLAVSCQIVSCFGVSVSCRGVRPSWTSIHGGGLRFCFISNFFPFFFSPLRSLVPTLSLSRACWASVHHLAMNCLLHGCNKHALDCVLVFTSLLPMKGCNYESFGRLQATVVHPEQV